MKKIKKTKTIVGIMALCLLLGIESLSYAEEESVTSLEQSVEQKDSEEKDQGQTSDLPKITVEKLADGLEYNLILKNVSEFEYEYIVLKVWSDKNYEDDVVIYPAERVDSKDDGNSVFYQAHVLISNHKHLGTFQAIAFGVNSYEEKEITPLDDITVEMLSDEEIADEIAKVSFQVSTSEKEESNSTEIIEQDGEREVSSEITIQENKEESLSSKTIPGNNEPSKALQSPPKSMAQVQGIDVSHHNGTINWSAVKAAGIRFAIIRCGYGDNISQQDDREWINNVSQCEKLGIPYGVYIYSYATNTTMARSEADHCIRLLQGHNPQYPVYLDLEDQDQLSLSNTTLLKITVTWAERIRAAGYKPGVYSSLSWWRTKLDSANYNNYYRWVAQWNTTCTYTGSYQMWQYSSQGSINGISGHVDMNFWYGGVPANTTGWVNIGGYYYFYNSQGEMVIGWLSRGGTRYYFDDNGIMATGWRDIDGSRYFFSNGGFMTTGWLYQGGAYYLFKSDGKMVTGWADRGGARYYFNSDGKMVTGWKTIDEAKYYFTGGGFMMTGWLYQGGVYYLFKSDGKMATGWTNRGGARYYFSSDGKMVTGWKTINGAKYCFTGGGIMITGWLYQGEVYYLFKSDGKMSTGWINRGGVRYYFGDNGAMTTGWRFIDGDKYYFTGGGFMVTGKVQIENEWYTFANDGRLIG